MTDHSPGGAGASVDDAVQPPVAGGTAEPDHTVPYARLAVVNEAGRALLNARGFDDVYGILHDAARRLLEHDVFYIGLYSTDHQSLRVDYYVEEDRVYPGFERNPLPKLAELLSQRLEPLLLNSREEMVVKSDGRPWRLGNVERAVQSAIFVPLINNERVLGVLTVQDYRPGVYNGRDVDVLQLLGHQAAAAIENARLWRAQQESLVAHRVLVSTARELHTTLDDNDVARVVARELRRVVPCRRSLLIMLLNDARSRFEPVHYDGVLANIDPDRNRAPSDEGICGHVLRTRHPFVMGPGDAAPFAVDIEGAPDSPHSLLAVPLIGHRDPIGVMVLTRGPDEPVFEEREADLALLFADQAATAIENARLYRLARTQADRDGLTGLLNHRALQQALKQQLKLAGRTGRPLAVLMLDLDRFKTINDTMGHLTGDRVLRRVADQLRATCRTTDLVGRYGGEEFVVIFPDTDADGALATAERIRAALAADPLHGSVPAVRVSGGVAVAPRDGNEPDALIERADIRLYAGKRRGGNVVVGPEESRGVSLPNGAPSLERAVAELRAGAGTRYDAAMVKALLDALNVPAV